MCKIKGVTLGIKDLNFTARRGKMLVRLTDGRVCTAEPTLLCTFYRMLRMTPKLTPVKRLI
jgi:hypothetical protein